jgi:NAD(P)H-dependent FMN reductase
MLKVGIIVGSTRPGRKAAAVAEWVHNLLKRRVAQAFDLSGITNEVGAPSFAVFAKSLP